MWVLSIELKSYQYKSTVLSVCLLSHIDCIARCLIVMFFNFSGFLELLKIVQLVSFSCIFLSLRLEILLQTCSAFY